MCERRTVVLVIEDEVRPPHQAAGDVDDVQTIVVLFVPPQVSVVPRLPDPQVGDQHLVPLVLRRVTVINNTFFFFTNVLVLVGIEETLSF